MRRFLFSIALSVLAVLAWSAEPVPTAKKAPVRKKTIVKRTPAAAISKTGKRGSWRSRQMAPTPERYKQIQQALASKGYLKPAEATGTWSQSSVDALKRFQAEQHLDSTGKINSLSLIALGLGPRHEAGPGKPAAPLPPQQEPPAAR